MIFRLLSLVTAFAVIPTVTFAGECGASECGTASSCQECDPCQQCETCEPTIECSVCGGQGACNSCCAVSIDVDSLTCDAQSKKLYDAQQARLIFRFTDDKYSVYLAGRKMMTPGKLRSFTVPVGDQDRDFEYDVKVDYLYHGQVYHKKHTFKTMRAGTIIAIEVQFERPEEEKGEPATFVFDPKTSCASGGGAPEDQQGGNDANGDGVMDGSETPVYDESGG